MPNFETSTEKSIIIIYRQKENNLKKHFSLTM